MPAQIFRLLIAICCFGIIVTLYSCDPVRLLEIRAADKPNYSVTVYANKNILPFEKNKQNEKLVLRFPSDELAIKRDTSFRYGIGTWPDRKGLIDFAKNFDSIIIVRNGAKQRLIDEAAITDYLLKQRHGFGKSILTIVAN